MCQTLFRQSTKKLPGTKDFICCYHCEQFINDNELCIEEIAKQSTETFRKLIKEAKQEWRANKENAANIYFKRGEIYEETR